MRLPDWPQRLDDEIAAARSRSFEYGRFDCALFAADCVRAMTGIDYAEKFRGYESKTAAYRIIAEYGSFEALLTSLLGEPIEPALAGRGDVVLAQIPAADEGLTVGVCLGVFCAFPWKEVGVVMHRRTVIRMAWRVS